MTLEFPGIEGNGEIYLDVLRAICGEVPYREDSSMVDLMCHKAPYTHQLGFKHRLYVDIQDRELDSVIDRVGFVQMDVVEFISKNTYHYDVAICSDGLEHLTIAQANDVTWGMVAMADKHIFFTPLGEQGITNDNHPDSHKTGWTPNSANLQHCACIIFPDFHPTLNCGAFFAWGVKNPDELPADFERVKQELNIKKWVKLHE